MKLIDKVRLMIVGALITGFVVGYGFRPDPAPVQDEPPEVHLSAMTIDANQIIQCEFETPITSILSIVRWYDDYESLNETYHESMQEWPEEYWEEMGYTPDNEVWGWSDCEWQPENDIAMCDIHTVLPTVMIDGELSAEFDTFGHEVFHGACGDFHD